MPSEPTIRVVAPSAVVVDGMTAPALAEPDSPSAVADLLAEAAERGHAVAPVGGGTALALGNPPERLDLAISTARLGGIIDYEPTDLVLSVGAGARIGNVQAILGEHGQTLPIESPGGGEATIGGLIATGLAGPRRLSAGTLRDLLIGISVAHPSGTVTKAGGMVVKNVSGFDLTRLYHGSLGTLGVVVSANFKVVPLPRAEATVIAAAPSLDAAIAAAGRVRASDVQPTALEAALIDGAWLAAVRITGREGTVHALATTVRDLLGSESTTIETSESAAWWTRYVEHQELGSADDSVLVRSNVRPRDTGPLARGFVTELPRLGVEIVFLAASVGLGSVVARLRFSGGGSEDRLAEVQSIMLALAENVTILAAPPEWKHGIDVWGRPPETLDVMRTLKGQFDPARVLNPGRFAGGI